MTHQGQRIGEYLLDEKVGQGAFGEVWRAHHHVWTDQLAAVKIPTHPEYVKNLRREGIAMARLDHPNIVRPLGFDPYADVPYLITEFIPGTSLRPVIVSRALGFDDAVAVIRQVLTGLEEAHSRGVVHGDIKPENILVHQSTRQNGFKEHGTVKVTDFGVGLAATTTATEALSGGSFKGSSSLNLAATLAYVSPEQRDGTRQTDARSDLFSVGVVLFELLTGERPVGNDLPTELNFKVPVYLDDVFRRAYARREKRFASAREFLDALETGRQRKPTVPLGKPVMKVEPDTVSLHDTNVAHAPPAPIVESTDIGFKEDDTSVGSARLTSSPAQTRTSDDLQATAGMTRDAIPIDLASTRAAQDFARPADDVAPPGSLENETVAGFGNVGTRAGDTGTPAGESRAPVKKPLERKPAPPAVPIDAPTQRTDAPATIGFDEQRQKSVHSPGELILRLRELENARNLDAGERANLILRLNTWASEYSKGHLTDFGKQIEVLKGVEAPTYRVTARERRETGPATQRRSVVVHPAVPGAVEQAMKDSDYTVQSHVSAARVRSDWFNPVPPPHLREAVRKALETDPADVVRQDVRIESAMTFALRYRYDAKEYDVCFVGPDLRVVAPVLPFEPGAFDLTKRAASLLDANQVPAGVRELRKCIETGYREQQAVGMLRALRRKLSVAYMAVASDQLRGIDWLESLQTAQDAQVLDPDSAGPRDHAHQVDIRAMLIHTTPANLVALAFCLFASMSTSSAGAYGYLAAAGASVLSGVVIWRTLRARLARTDIGFYHSAVVPTLISGAVAIGAASRESLTTVIVCAVVILGVIVTDVVLFKKFRRQLLRGPMPEQVPVDAMEGCVRVESMVNRDWDRISSKFERLPPLTEFTKAKR